MQNCSIISQKGSWHWYYLPILLRFPSFNFYVCMHILILYHSITWHGQVFLTISLKREKFNTDLFHQLCDCTTTPHQNVPQNTFVYLNVFCIKCLCVLNILNCVNDLWYCKLHPLSLIRTLVVGVIIIIHISGEKTEAQWG